MLRGLKANRPKIWLASWEIFTLNLAKWFIIFHQPGFPWNSRGPISLPKSYRNWGPRSCEVTWEATTSGSVTDEHSVSSIIANTEASQTLSINKSSCEATTTNIYFQKWSLPQPFQCPVASCSLFFLQNAQGTYTAMSYVVPLCSRLKFVVPPGSPSASPDGPDRKGLQNSSVYTFNWCKPQIRLTPTTLVFFVILHIHESQDSWPGFTVHLSNSSLTLISKPF